MTNSLRILFFVSSFSKTTPYQLDRLNKKIKTWKKLFTLYL